MDVAVPIERAYEQFTHLDDFAKFMSKGEIVDERANERITWRTTAGLQATARITFHRLSDRLTHVMVMYDYQPESLVKRVSSGFRMFRRALRSDLMRFKALVESDEEDAEAPPRRDEKREARPRARGRRRHEPDEDEEYDEEGEWEEEEAPGAEYEDDVNEEGPEEREDEEEPEPERVASRPVRRRAPSRPSRPPRRR